MVEMVWNIYLFLVNLVLFIKYNKLCVFEIKNGFYV